jgi:hypothetical protein
MSDRDRTGFGHDTSGRGPLDKATDALVGHDDPNRGPLDRAANALRGHDDPNRGPLDRAANALSGRDDPNRGPVDRAANAFGGHDDPNRGPLDRAANAVTGGSGGIGAALGAGTSTTDHTMGESRTVSAMFDSNGEAERAVSELRQMGVSDSALSIIAQSKRTMTTRGGDGEITDEEHSSVLRGILGGGAAGAGLGVLALAIPGVGPLAALGAIAASAVPEAMAIGALAGAAAGTFNETLKNHGVSDEDASYYGDRLKTGGVLVTAHVSGPEGERVRDVLYRNGGHSSSQARTTTL